MCEWSVASQSLHARFSCSETLKRHARTRGSGSVRRPFGYRQWLPRDVLFIWPIRPKAGYITAKQGRGTCLAMETRQLHSLRHCTQYRSSLFRQLLLSQPYGGCRILFPCLPLVRFRFRFSFQLPAKMPSYSSVSLLCSSFMIRQERRRKLPCLFVCRTGWLSRHGYPVLYHPSGECWGCSLNSACTKLWSCSGVSDTRNMSSLQRFS